MADKISKSGDIFEKIDLQNKSAWEVRITDSRQSLFISEQAYLSSIALKYEKGLAESLRNQASVYLKLSNYDKSFQKAIEALELYRRLKDKSGEAVIINLLGNGSYALGDYENTLRYHLLCLQIREELNDTKGIVHSLINIGNVYANKKDDDNALKHFLKALELERNYDDGQSSKALILGNIGSIYLNKNDPHKALEYYFESLKLAGKDYQNKFITNNYLNIADAYSIIGDNTNVEKYYRLSLETAVSMENKLAEAMSLLGFGKLFFKQNKTPEAIQYFEKALAIAEPIPLKSVLPQIYLALSEAWLQVKDLTNALSFHKKFYNEKEREFKEETEKKMQNLLVLHQVDLLKKEHSELKKLNEEVENKNRRIMESIDYAKHIQDSILPHATSLKQYFSDSFVFNRPKDIISGDFFWLYEKENDVLIAAVDCTGHGVSGALMSVVINSLLNQVTANHWMPNPSFVLNEMNHYMKRTLTSPDDSGLRDSMDIALCAISKNKTELLFTGAHNALYFISDGILTEYKGDNISMGNSAATKFSSHRIKLKKDDCIYIFTDGFADQKGGGPERKKFYYNPFKNLLLKIHKQPMEKQKLLLDETMNEWMGDEKQIDDMLIIGIKI